MESDAQSPSEPSTSDQTLCGLLVIDKPSGLSSMSVCARVRGALRRNGAPKRVKVGHGGTLDPLATGVLVVLCGKATPLCDRVMRGTKRYSARIDLSAFTTTDDREGERTEVVSTRTPSRQDVEHALSAFVGQVMQRPPVYSAMKVGGRRAYALARKGEAVELEPRPVFIQSIEIVEYAWPFVDLDIVSGKGVYIRSIARDLGIALGTGGTLASLRRTAVGAFTIDHAIPLDGLPNGLTQTDLIPVDRWIDE